MIRIVTAAMVLLVLFNRAGAQGINKDSLQKVLAAAGQDSNRVKTLVKLAEAYGSQDTLRSDAYAGEALQLSEKIKYTAGKFSALRMQAILFRLKGKPDSALKKHQDYLALAESLQDKDKMGIGNLNVGEAYNNTGDNEKALAYCLKGFQLLENSPNKALQQDAYASLQRLYAFREEFEKSVVYGKKAVSVARDMNDKKRLAKCMYNLAFTYNMLKKFDSSASICREVIGIAKQIDDQQIETFATYNLASISLRSGDYNAALPYALQVLALSKSNNDKDMESNAMSAIGLCYLLKKDYVQARSYYEQAIAIKEPRDDAHGLAGLKNSLSNAYFALGEPVTAYKLHLEAEDYMEEYNKSMLSEQSAELEKKYETEKKENQIQLQQSQLKQKNILNYMLIGGAAALLIILLLMYRTYTQKQKLQQQRISELETAQRLSDTEAVLKGEEQERSRLAKELHDGLGGMLSGIKHSFQNMKGNMVMTPDNQQAFDRSLQMLDTSIKEMRRVAHNMMPEALVKFGLDAALKDFVNDVNQTGALNISYQSIGVDNEPIDQSVAISIYRIVQELINNTMKHAVAKNAIVQLSRNKDHFSLTVEDDGKGFDTAILQAAKGIGWANIQNRVSLLNGTLDVQSEKDKGTSVLIEVPLDK
ncbi:MAG: sensor histidine kinase [Ferruginibacter sp.]